MSAIRNSQVHTFTYLMRKMSGTKTLNIFSDFSYGCLTNGFLQRGEDILSGTGEINPTIEFSLTASTKSIGRPLKIKLHKSPSSQGHGGSLLDFDFAVPLNFNYGAKTDGVTELQASHTKFSTYYPHSEFKSALIKLLSIN